MPIDLRERVRMSHGFEEDSLRLILVANVTNRCNLSCAHCFLYRDGNPNEALSPRLEMTDDVMLEVIEALRDRHGARVMVWLGGEPMLRRSLLERGVGLFDYNVIDTNGTIPLVDLGPLTSYLVSVEGPPDVNDTIRGTGTFARVLRNLESLPDDFASAINIQCTVTTASQGRLGELLDLFLGTRAGLMTFSFYVPGIDDTSELGWPTLDDRRVAVEEVRRLKLDHPEFVTNNLDALDLMAPEHVPGVVAGCPFRSTVLPLFADGDRFTTAFCTYGNNVDCSRCGAWIAYEFAAEPFGFPQPEDD
jgi:MoaA/NifB/PqqE/SkfB family radical SAM enzyme